MAAVIWRWWNGSDRTIRKGSPRWRYWMLRLDLRDWWRGGPPKTTWYDCTAFSGDVHNHGDH